MTRRVNGQGSKPFQRAGGKSWYSQVWLTDQRTGEMKRVLVSGKTKTQLAENITRRRREAEEGYVAATGGDQLVETYAETWLTKHLPDRELTENSARLYEHALRNHVLPTIGKLRLSALREVDIKRIDRAIKNGKKPNGKPYANSTRRSAYNVARMMLDCAVTDRLIRINPATTVPRPADHPRRQAHYNVSESRRLIEAVSEHRILRHMIPLMLYTAVRPGEALSLTWDNVSLDGETPHIIVCATNAVDKHGRTFRQAFTKSDRVRVVPLVPDAVAVLRAAKTARATDRLAVGEAWTENRLVFAHEDGRLIDDRNLRRQYAPLVKSAELTGSFQALRRSAATLLTSKDVPLVIVAEILGHSSTSVTQAHYTIVDTQMMSSALSKLAHLYREAQ